MMKGNPRITDKRCPKCGHHQGWTHRGMTVKSTYTYKCSKCGYKED